MTKGWALSSAGQRREGVPAALPGRSSVSVTVGERAAGRLGWAGEASQALGEDAQAMGGRWRM